MASEDAVKGAADVTTDPIHARGDDVVMHILAKPGCCQNAITGKTLLILLILICIMLP